MPHQRVLELLLIVFASISSVHATDEVICKSIEIKSLADFKELRNCSIIVGHVHIANLELDIGSLPPDAISFVKEITDYMLIYRVHGLPTLQQIFPQLTIIRGDQLLFDKYALVVHENRNLEDLGLISLLRIQNGDIRIEANPSLCFVDTINWVALLGNSTKQNFSLKKNKSPNHCALCKIEQSVEMKDFYRHCWNLENPQLKSDFDNNITTSCSRNCLKGCTENICKLCTGYLMDGKCIEVCPESYYQYNKRECLQKKECHDKGWIPHAGICSEKCPQNYRPIADGNGQLSCKLVCTGNYIIHTTHDLSSLKDCTTIKGSLIIELTEMKSVIINTLDMLIKIREITGYLKITDSPQLISLYFLRNLNTIRGDELIDNKYAFYVVNNYHLEHIWVTNQNVAILKGHVYFHLNPRLCYEKIMQLAPSIKSVDKITIVDASPNSNGERVVCGDYIRILNATVEAVNATAARIKVNPMSADDKLAMIGYIHHYKEAPVKNVTMYDGRHGCGHDNWRMDITPDINVRHIIRNLKPYTQYAFFVKTLTMIDYHIQVDAYSKIQYFQTLPNKPGPVSKIYYYALSASEIVVHWWPPRQPNGIIKEYILFYEKFGERIQNLTNRKYVFAEKNNNEQECKCETIDPHLSGPTPNDENYYNKAQVVYDEALPDIVYFSGGEVSTDENAISDFHSADESNTLQRKTRQISENDINKLENSTLAEQAHHKALEEKAIAEQDTGTEDFVITKSLPICSYTNPTIQYQLENSCKALEYFKGTSIPGHILSFTIKNLDPDFAYRVSVRGCVKDLKNGCGPALTILAESMSKSAEAFLKQFTDL